MCLFTDSPIPESTQVLLLFQLEIVFGSLSTISNYAGKINLVPFKHLFFEP